MPAIAPIVGAVVAAAITSAVGATLAAVIGAVVTAALSMGMGALMKSKPDKPVISARRDQLLVTTRDPTRAREMVVGKVRKGGTIIFMDTADNDTSNLMWIAFAGHEVTAIDEIYFFDELGIDQSGNIQPKFQGFVQYEKFLGTDDQQASRMLIDATPKWTEDHRCRGIAGIALKLQRSGDIFSQPPNVTAVIRGAKMYDPRDGTTSYTNNAALSLAYYLNHPIYGLEAPYGTVIDNSMLGTAANICDEDVAIKAGQTLQFNTDTDVVALSNADLLNPPGSFTLEARIYPTDLSNVRPIILKDDGVRGYGLYLQPSGILRFFVRGLNSSTVDSPVGTITANTWQHISGRYDAALNILGTFVNGILVAQISVTGAIANTSARMAIGGGFRGRIQDVRLWWEARQATAINTFKDRSLSGTEANLAVYLPLNEKRGLVAEDACEIPNDGTITGAVWVDDDSVIGTEKRYQANGVIFSDQLPREIIEDLLSAMVGSAVPSGGKWLIRAGAFETPTVSFDENDARDSIVVNPWRPRNELFNSVRGTYLAPENDWQPADFPIITFPTFEAQDGPIGSPRRITQDIELPFTSSSSMAQRIAWLHLLRNREQVSCTFRTKLRGLRVRAGDFLDLTNQRFGWDGKPFEVITWEFVPIQDEQGNPALGIDMELREIAAVVFDFNPATDEVPVNPSRNTRLPSPFGRMATVTDFVDRNGFEEIISPDQAGVWPGTMFGLIPNPLTGHLNAEDLIPAVGDDQSIFDEYVRDPVPFPFYESPEIDIEFEDTVRTYIDATFGRGPGEDGRIEVSKFYDVKVLVDDPDTSGFNPDAFNPDAFSTGITDPVERYEGWKRIHTHVKAYGRYFKHKVEFDFRESAGFLATFTPIVDKMTLFQRGVAETIPVGGKTIFYNKRYHNIPSLNSGIVSGGAGFIEFSEKSDISFKATRFNGDADDAGGTIDWTAAGV